VQKGFFSGSLRRRKPRRRHLAKKSGRQLTIATSSRQICLIYSDDFRYIQIYQTFGFQALRDTATYGEAFIQEGC
jgi:hypothetical protein